jgi:hypothetical protein
MWVPCRAAVGPNQDQPPTGNPSPPPNVIVPFIASVLFLLVARAWVTISHCP